MDITLEDFDENYYFHYLRGVDEGISLDVEPIRKWTIYFLRGSSLSAHESIVFQPWTLYNKDEKLFYPLQYFTTVEKRFNEHNKPYMFVSRLDLKYHSQLKQIAEIAMSLQVLYDFLTEIFLSLQTKELSGNCDEFVISVAKILPFHRQCNIWGPLEDIYYPRFRKRYRKLLREKIANEIQNKQAENVLATVGAPIFKIRDRIAHVLTDIQGKYNAMTPIYTMYIMLMFYFDTIGEIIFPIMALSSVYLLYYVVISYYRKRELKASSATFYREWHFAPKMRLLLTVIHVFSILHMLCDVFTSIHCLQAMLITQLMWLNFLSIDRELEIKATNAIMLFGLMKTRRNKTCLFRDNIQQNITRLVMLSTFLFPSTFLFQITFPVLIFLQIAVLVKFSHVNTIIGSSWLKVPYFTGHSNPLFNIYYSTSLVVITACILYSNRIVTAQCLTSKYHIFYLLTYFSLSMIMHYKILQQKADYAAANDGCLAGNVYELQRVPAWYFHLSIFSKFDNEILTIFIVILTIFIMTFDYMSSLFLLNVTLFIGYFLAGLTCNVKFFWDPKTEGPNFDASERESLSLSLYLREIYGTSDLNY